MPGLLSRRESVPWPNPQESLGNAIETDRTGALRAWYAKGPALQRFKDDIKPDLDAILQHSDLSNSQPLFLRLYMIGPSDSTARPTVMVCCVEPSIRKDAESYIKRSKKLAEYPGFALGSAALPLQSRSQPAPYAELMYSGHSHLEDEPKFSLLGSQMSYTCEEEGWSRVATGGPVVRIGGRLCQVTVGHLFEQPDYNDLQQDQGWDLDECSFDNGFDDEWIDENVPAREQQPKPLGTPLISEKPGAQQSASSGREHFNIRMSQWPTDESDTDCQPRQTQRRMPCHCATSDSIVVGSPELDYAMIEIDEDDTTGFLNLVSFSAKGGEKILHVSEIAEISLTESNVFAITSSAGAIPGTLLPDPMSWRRPGKIRFQDVYTIILQQPLDPGDCGSAVIDSQSGKLYGHVVLADPGTSLGYIVPTVDVFTDVERRTKKQVVLYAAPTEQAVRQGQVQRYQRHSTIHPNKQYDRIHADSLDLAEPFRDVGNHDIRLGTWSIMCLVINRMIGTGIYNSPQMVMQGTQNAAASLIIWLVGGVVTLTSMMVYIEHGISVPKYISDVAYPRGGGDKNYLEYVVKPKNHKWVRILRVFLFALLFVAIGSLAGNSISFASHVLRAASVRDELPRGHVQAIAVAVIVFCCFVHTLSRRAGIFLNGTFAIIKVLLLIVIIGMGILVGVSSNFNSANLIISSPTNALTPDHTSRSNWGTALLATMFAYGGFEGVTSNYVLHPHRTRLPLKFSGAATMGVGIVTFLYIGVNASYFLVVPQEERLSHNMVSRFFELVFGRLSFDSRSSSHLLSVFIMLSSFGDVAIMTYTCASIIQEINKSGTVHEIGKNSILPYRLTFTVGLTSQFSTHRYQNRIAYLLRLVKRLSERVRIWLLLATASIFVVLLATWMVAQPNSAYLLLTGLDTYFHYFFHGMLGLGTLYLYLQKNRKQHIWWSQQHLPPGITSMLWFVIGSALAMSSACALAFASGLAVGEYSALRSAWYTMVASVWAIFALGGVWSTSQLLASSYHTWKWKFRTFLW